MLQAGKNLTIKSDNATSVLLLLHLLYYRKDSGLWKSATKSGNRVSIFCHYASKEYADILASSLQGYSYRSSAASPPVSLVSKAFWIKFSALMYGNPSSLPNAILPKVFLSEPQPLKTKHSEITAGSF